MKFMYRFAKSYKEGYQAAYGRDYKNPYDESVEYRSHWLWWKGFNDNITENETGD